MGMYLQVEITGNADDDGIALISDLRNTILKECGYSREATSKYMREIAEMLNIEAEEIVF